MREILWDYMGKFTKLYPSHPVGSWELYERALADVGDLDLAAACEICLKECSYFPMPAEIRKRIAPKDTFISTAPKFDDDNPPDAETKAAFEAEMDKVREKLGLRR